MANSARRHGEPARILMGVRNDGEVTGIGEFLSDYGQCDSDVERWENMKRSIQHIAGQYIEPQPDWDLKHGMIEDKQVAYILIEPGATPERYHVARDYISGKGARRETRLVQGESWIRSGESNRKIGNKPFSGDESSYAYTQVPFLLPSHWLNYFEGLRSDLRFSGAYELKGYQEQMLESADRHSLKQMCDHFESSDDRTLILSGQAGSGKTTLIRRWVYRLAEAGHASVAENRRREEFTPPPSWIPVYLALSHDRIESGDRLTQWILDRFNEHARAWGVRPQEGYRLLSQSNLKWIIFLDGLDEVGSDDEMRLLLAAVNAFASRFPSLKQVITTRTIVARPDWRNWHKSLEQELSGFSDEEIINYVNSCVPIDAVGPLLETLQREDELWSLCRVPLFLEALVDEFANYQLSGGASEASLHKESTVLSTSADPFLAAGKPEIPAEEDTSIPSFQTEELVLSEPVEHDSNFPAAAGAGKRVQHRSLQPSCERGSHRAIAYMLDRVFRGLWEREQRRTTQSPLNTGQWWERMGYFAMETDGKQRLFRYQTAADHLGSEQALYWVMSLGIITGASETLLKFVSELVKVYFAADRMISLHQTGETQLLRSEIQAAEREFRNRVLCMVDDLSVADVKEFI